MPKQCPDCQQVFPDFVDFCVSDGSRLERVAEPERENENETADPPLVDPAPEPQSAPLTATPGHIPGRARLLPRVRGELQPCAVEFYGDVVLGRFDPEQGAVDVDLSDVPDNGYISARHARLTYEDGRWEVEDLASENGVFINRGPRITEPTALQTGDELALGNAIFVFDADEPEEADHRG